MKSRAVEIDPFNNSNVEESGIPDESITGPTDVWLRQPGAWLRIHTLPRRKLFIPDGTTPGGPNVEMLSSRRITRAFYLDTHSTVIHDDWNNSPEGGQSKLPKIWTGLTIFYDIDTPEPGGSETAEPPATQQYTQQPQRLNVEDVPKGVP